MPLKEGTTVEDVLRVIVDTTLDVASSYARPGDGQSQEAVIAVSNAGYIMLSRLGFDHDEAREMLKKRE